MPERRTVNRSISTEPELVKTTDLKVAAMAEHYQNSVGRVLTPGDFEKLIDFADTYPDGLFEKTVDEYSGKPLSYLEKVMENKQKEGESGKHRKSARRLRPRENYTPSPNDEL